jgi:hypothetical protein
MLKNLTYEELEAWCVSMGEPPRRAEQIWRWMYYKHPYISSFQEAVGTQNGFSAAFAAAAGQVASLEGGLQLEEVVAAADGTTKLVLKLTEGEGRGSSVEAVLIPAQHRSQGKLRLTLCVSSQVGAGCVEGRGTGRGQGGMIRKHRRETVTREEGRWVEQRWGERQEGREESEAAAAAVSQVFDLQLRSQADGFGALLLTAHLL